MKNAVAPKTWQNPPAGALPITEEELIAFGIPKEAIVAGEHRGDLKTVGMWQLPKSYTALCMSAVFDDSKGYTRTTSATVYGIRTLSGCNQSGYALEGKVSVEGRKVRGFTSSQLFELPDKRLVNVATIHACIN